MPNYSELLREMATLFYLLLLCTIVVAQYQGSPVKITLISLKFSLYFHLVERTWLRRSEDTSHEKRFDSRNMHSDKKAPAPAHRTIRRNRRNASTLFRSRASTHDEMRKRRSPRPYGVISFCFASVDENMNVAVGDETRRRFQWLTQRPVPNDHNSSEPPRSTKRPEGNMSR